MCAWGGLRGLLVIGSGLDDRATRTGLAALREDRYREDQINGGKHVWQFKPPVTSRPWCIRVSVHFTVVLPSSGGRFRAPGVCRYIEGPSVLGHRVGWFRFRLPGCDSHLQTSVWTINPGALNLSLTRIAPPGCSCSIARVYRSYTSNRADSTDPCDRPETGLRTGVLPRSSHQKERFRITRSAR